MKKKKVLILFGGRSAEHEVSVRSARTVYQALDKSKYDVFLIGISKQGEWLKLPTERSLLEAPSVEKEASSDLLEKPEYELVSAHVIEELSSVDVVFPVLHGPYGEDGTVQGMLRLMNIPAVGAGVLGSAIGMDKDVMKRLLKEAGIPVAHFITLHKKDISTLNFGRVVQSLGLPVFIKPANLGSSVGVSKVKNETEFQDAIYLAFQYDTKILIEEMIVGREIELSVLGNNDPIVSIAGEIISTHGFYDYQAKYIDEDGAKLEIPAKLAIDELEKLQTIAIQAFQCLECRGMARVDCFLTERGEVYVNEINTIPGFTNISMYPKLWEASGISYSELVDRLINLALEKFEEEKKLKTDYT